jgi:hypothetical protein
MSAAVEQMRHSGELSDADAARMLDYFAMAAQQMVNAPG